MNKSKYTILIIEDEKLDKGEFLKMIQNKAVVYIASLPESGWDRTVKDIEEMQDRAAQNGDL